MKNRKRRSAAVLAAGMSVLLGAGTITGATEQTDADNSIRKEVTVYVNTEADGPIKEITVSEWLKNAKTLSDSTITDISDLSDIKNTKGDEGFTQDGKTLTWETDGRDIHYEGKTEKDLPVTVTFSYELDGRKIKPEDLAGKTGHLKIHVAYENHAVTTKKISGKSVKLYSPFMMLTGMILSTDHFSNVTVDNGKVVEDDSRNIVLGIAMPGLKESLDLSEDMAKDISIPEEFTVEADVTECEMSSSFTVAMTDVLDEIDLNDLNSIDDLQDSIKKMTKAASKLMKGTKSLSEGVDTLNEKYKEFDQGIDALSTGVSALESGAQKLDDGAGTLNGGAAALSSGAATLAQGVSAYTEGTGTLASGLKQYTGGVDTLSGSMSEMKEGVQSYTEGVDSYVSGGSKLAEGTVAYVKGTSSLTDYMKKYIKGSSALSDSMVRYLEEIKTLLSSMDILIPGMDETLKDTKAAADKMQSLSTSLDADAIADLSENTSGYAEKISAYNSQVERYVESVEQLGQKISALQENISKISDGKNISQITPDVQEAADTLKDNADIMNTQAETIENWISSAGETTIDTTTVDQGISDVRNNLFAAESSLSRD